MIRKILLLSLIIAVLAISCSGSKCHKKDGPFNYSGYKQPVSLIISDMTSLPGETVILGGRYHDGANTVHPAMFISFDGGKSWEQTAFKFRGMGIQNLQTYGQNNIWAIAAHKQEGGNSPQYLLKSKDSGKNWRSISLESISINEPLPQIKDFIFFDDLKGLITISGSTGGINAFTTKNGGQTWKLLWKSHNNINDLMETGYTYPGFTEPPENTPAWTKQHDYYKITGILRLIHKKTSYRIEKYDFYKNRAWSKISEIPGQYEITKGHLIPISTN